MAGAPHIEVVSWHHTAGEGPLDVPLHMGDLARTADPRIRRMMLIPGWAEGWASIDEAIATCEALGRPAFGFLLPFHALPHTKANLLKPAMELPLVVAQHAAEGEPVNMMMHSLGNTAMASAGESPDSFDAIFPDAPYMLASADWSRLPVIGSLEFARPLAAITRLGWGTRRQLSEHRDDPRLQEMIDEGGEQIRTLGRHMLSAATFASSDRVLGMIAGAMVKLDATGHLIITMTGEHDKIAPPHEVQPALRRIERHAGLPEGHFRLVVLPKLGHSPWFLSSERKFAEVDRLLRTHEQTQAPG